MIEDERINNNEETKNSVPDITNSGSMRSLTVFINNFLKALGDFTERIDRTSLSTKLILLIIALAFILPISVGITVYLIFVGMSIILRG